MLELIRYSAQVTIDRIEGGGTTSSTPQNSINLFTTVPNWTQVSARGYEIALFLKNPCQHQARLKLRKTDHARLQRSLQLYINQGDLSVTSFQEHRGGAWHVRINKLRQRLVDPTTVTCSCMANASYYGGARYLCRLKSTAQSGGAAAAAAAAAAAHGRSVDRKTLQDLLILLPVNMRPLGSTADQDDIECLGEQNAVDMAFKKAEASGDIIVLD